MQTDDIGTAPEVAARGRVPWWQAPMACLDTETTGVDPETARIVTASLVVVGPGGVLHAQHWLADPGVDIPAGATAVHGITTEHARACGAPARDVLYSLGYRLRAAWADRMPVVAMNAVYDLTVVQRELARHGLPPLSVGRPADGPPVLDPLVLDRVLHPYRRGGRKLADLARHYRVKVEGEHTSEEDALTAGRVVWRMARYPRIGGMRLWELHAWQARAHAKWAANYQTWLRTKADPRQPDAVVDPSWPQRPAPADETRTVAGR